MNNHPLKFSLSMRIMHWAMALLIVAMLAAGLSMVGSLDPWQFTLLNLHKSFGIFVFILVLIRLALRLKSRLPELPKALPSWQKLAARSTHSLLYLMMLLMPLSGYLMQYFAGRPINVFDWFYLPASIEVDIQAFAFFRELHGYSALALILLIIIHVAAALHHHFIRKDSVLRSMM